MIKTRLARLAVNALFACQLIAAFVLAITTVLILAACVLVGARPEALDKVNRLHARCQLATGRWLGNTR